MLLADRGYDEAGSEKLAAAKGAWANIPPKSNTALEYFQFAITQEWNLAEGLARQVIGLPSVERDCSHRISKSSFLARPPEPQIAYKTTGTFGHPIVGPDDQAAHTPPQASARLRASLSIQS